MADPETGCSNDQVDVCKDQRVDREHLLQFANTVMYQYRKQHEAHAMDVKQGDIIDVPVDTVYYTGEVELPECSGEWQDGIHTFVVGDTAKFIIFCAQDVSMSNLSFNPLEFQNTVYDESSKLQMNPSNSRIEKLVTESMGSQLLRFSLNKSGNFLLGVQNMVKNLTGSPYRFSYNEGQLSVQHCTGKWKTGVSKFEVGTLASLVIRQSDEYGNPVFDADPLTIKAVQNNSSILVNLFNVSYQPLLKNKTEYRLLSFIVKEPGNFSLIVGNASVEIWGSPFSFSYTVGMPVLENTLVVGEGLSPLASVNFWNEIIVYIRDAYGNILSNVNASLGLSASAADDIEFEAFKPRPGSGFMAAYKPSITGHYNLTIFYNGLALPQSPFHVNVGAGWIQAKFCTAAIEPSSIVAAGDRMRIFVTAQDLQGNTVSYSSQAVSFNVTPLPLGISSPGFANAQIYDRALGLYSASFTIALVGTFKVDIDAYGSYINGSPYALTVIPGLQNIVNETFSGTKAQQFLANLTGSKAEIFNVTYIGNGVHQAKLYCNISRIYNLTVSYGGKAVNESPLIVFVAAGAVDPLRCTFTMSIAERVLIETYGVLTIQAKDSYGNNRTSGGGGFRVTFVNSKTSELYSGTAFDDSNGNYMFPFQLNIAGSYKINVTYNGIQIAGQEQIVVLRGSTEAVQISYITPTIAPTKNFTTLTMFGENLMQIISFSCNFGGIEKRPGRFNTTEETLQCDTPYIQNALTVQLVVQLTLYQGKSTFNFDITFYVDTTPIAMLDEVWSWKNDFVSFDPLSNDHVAYGAPTLLGVCKAPQNGTIEVVGTSLRYSPFLNFMGEDKLTYKISDFRGLITHGDVIVSVYELAPQILSVPQVLVGLEDQPIPSRGGIQGLDIVNPNMAETATVEAQAENGHLKFAEDLTHLWQGVQILSYDTVDQSLSNNMKPSLKFTGTFTLVSSALQALRYQGHLFAHAVVQYVERRESYFNGNDFIKLKIYNKKLEGSSKDILVMLQAKNNRPFINSSALIFLNASYWKTSNDIPITGLRVDDPDVKDTQGTTLGFWHYRSSTF
ncbi:hypothetical protein GOP47_0010618 [Adiantum capillus-veneris]|uniref:GEX2 N-terminal Ig-like domain-containing protein n=1 Tax=Adiantum capillus-veneris TaxID=13818 RepID=A0A9D4UVN1_ADICA|nr:hypothetical protein GOP47_0010618 [Adiantum capillus-veneris]